MSRMLSALPLPDFGAHRPAPRTLRGLAAMFDEAAGQARRFAQLMAQEAAEWGRCGKLGRQEDLLECAEMIGFEADRYAAAAAMIRRCAAFRAEGPSLVQTPGDPP